MSFAAREGPLLVVHPPAQLSDVIVDTVLAELEAHLQCGDPYVLVFDLSTTGMPTPTQRRKLAEHMTTHEAAIRQRVMGLAIVAPNAVVRGIVTALFWLATPPIQHCLCASRSEASAWAQQLLPRRTRLRS
jgi:hypothetical protein